MSEHGGKAQRERERERAARPSSSSSSSSPRSRLPAPPSLLLPLIILICGPFVDDGVVLELLPVSASKFSSLGTSFLSTHFAPIVQFSQL